jgi:hypothetical protein
MKQKNEYRNDSEGVCGVIVIDNGKEKGIPVGPGDSVWLSEEERIATANAPAKDEDNPLANGTLTLVTPAAEIKNRRPIGADELQKHPEPQEAEEKSEPQSEAPPAPPAPPKTPEQVQAEAKKKQEEIGQKAAQQAKAQAEQPGKPVDHEGSRRPLRSRWRRARPCSAGSSA